MRDANGNLINVSPDCATYDDRYVPDENGEVYKAGLYSSEDEALMAYQTKTISLQDEIWVRRPVKDTRRIKKCNKGK